MLNLDNLFEPGDPDEQETVTGDDVVEFMCDEDLAGVIPEPIPAAKMLPEWYKNLSREIEGTHERQDLRHSTVRACMPFLESMRMGWILKTPGEIKLTVDGDEFQHRSESNRKIMGSFPRHMVGDEFPETGPILKFRTQWYLKAPEGCSMLVTDPMNRPNDNFRCFSGVVSSDNYNLQITPPVLWTGGDFDGIIEKGTPICQIIVFERDGIKSDGVARTKTDEDRLDLKKQANQKKMKQRTYRDDMWEPIDSARMKTDY